jgi:hypothetical protein
MRLYINDYISTTGYHFNKKNCKKLSNIQWLKI